MPSGLTIKRVDDDGSLGNFVHSAVIGFGLPESSERMCFDLFSGLGFDLPLNNYVGYLTGQPVATSELFFGSRCGWNLLGIYTAGGTLQGNWPGNDAGTPAAGS